MSISNLHVYIAIMSNCFEIETKNNSPEDLYIQMTNFLFHLSINHDIDDYLPFSSEYNENMS